MAYLLRVLKLMQNRLTAKARLAERQFYRMCRRKP
jgi:hypothetical protein